MYSCLTSTNPRELMVMNFVTSALKGRNLNPPFYSATCVCGYKDLKTILHSASIALLYMNMATKTPTDQKYFITYTHHSVE